MRGLREPTKRQMIVAFLTGVDDVHIHSMDSWLTIRAAKKGVQSDSVRFGGASDFEQDSRLRESIILSRVDALEPNDRLYLLGHGDWRNQELGNWNAIEVANELGSWDLPDDIFISILGCSLARDSDSTSYGLVGNSINSFASNLHKHLMRQHNYRTIVYARAHNVGMGPTNPEKKGVYLEELAPSEATEQKITYKHNRSKVRFWWENGQQMRAWVNYTTNSLDPIDV